MRPLHVVELYSIDQLPIQVNGQYPNWILAVILQFPLPNRTPARAFRQRERKNITKTNLMLTLRIDRE